MFSSAIQRDLRDPDQMMISVRYSGTTIIGYINLKESDTIGELRKEIIRNSRVYAILRFRIDLVDNNYIILHKSSALPIDTTLTLGECGMKMGQGGNVVLLVCDPEEFELKVTDRDSNQSFTVEIASHEKVETLKDKIAQKTQIEPHMQILSFVDAEGKECFLKDGELLVDYKITGPCREREGRLLVHGLEDSNFDERIKFIYVGNRASGSEKTAASTSKMSERAGPSKRQS